MFLDRFYGGPLDGEIRDATTATLDGETVAHGDTGQVYRRAPELDSPMERAWRIEEPPPLMEPVRVEAPGGITLGELRAFVEDATRRGWPDEVAPRTVSGWRLRMTKIEVSERCRGRGPTK